MDDIDNIDYLTLYNSKLYKDEEKYKKAKEIFFNHKKKCLNMLLVFKSNVDIENKSEEEINALIKESIGKTKNQALIEWAMNPLISYWGISFECLDKKDKEEFYKLDLNFEAFQDYAMEFN